MERDFLITRTLLVVTGLALIIWCTMWFLDHYLPQADNLQHTAHAVDPGAAAGDTIGGQRLEMSEERENTNTGGR